MVVRETGRGSDARISMDHLRWHCLWRQRLLREVHARWEVVGCPGAVEDAWAHVRIELGKTRYRMIRHVVMLDAPSSPAMLEE